MPASVRCWKRVSEKAATATVTCFIFLTLGYPEGLCCMEQKIKVKGRWKSRKTNHSLNIRVRNKPPGTKLVWILSLVASGSGAHLSPWPNIAATQEYDKKNLGSKNLTAPVWWKMKEKRKVMLRGNRHLGLSSLQVSIQYIILHQRRPPVHQW